MSIAEIKGFYAPMLLLAQRLGTPVPVTRGHLAAKLVLDHGFARLHAQVVAILVV